MEDQLFNNQKVKKKYLKFLSSQEVLTEPFRDKLGQLNNFYLPLSKMIKEEYIKKKKNSGNRFNRRSGNWKVNDFQYFKNNFKGNLQFRDSNIFN